MATALHNNHPPHRLPHPSSILLPSNKSWPTSPNPSPPSSNSSASSHSSSATPRQNTQYRNSFSTSRRIRFAPLPDPRRAVLITDDGNELPLPEAEDATQFPGPSTPVNASFNTPSTSILASAADAGQQSAYADYPAQDNESIGSSSSSSRNSKRNSYSTDPSSVPSTPGTATPLSLTTGDHDYLSSVPASPSSFLPPALLANNLSTGTINKPKSKVLNSLLRPFKKGSSSSSSGSTHTLTPVASLEGRSGQDKGKGITKEEILTLGTINLFRASSRESKYTSGHESDPGSSYLNLARWTSTSSTGARSTTSNSGAPLARTQSTQSYTSRRPSTAPGFIAPSPSRSKGVPNTNPRLQGARMLNGRVYGARKRNPNANPFANVRDEEPEFVEWGYGGMGSVKGARSAGVSGSRWERLQGAGAGVPTGALADAEDDGSGMGWVKKRKMERERKEREDREKKEREEEESKKVEQEKEQEQKEDDVPTTTVEPPSSEPDYPTLPNIATLRTASSQSQSQRPSTPSSAHTTEEEHVLRAVTIPARPHYHHHHHRTHSRGSSKDITGSNLSLVHGIPAEEEKVTELEQLVEREDERREEESESSEEDEEIRGEDEDDEEDEEEEDEEQEKRRTALGAGVEKISRHKEVHDEPSSTVTTPAAEA